MSTQIWAMVVASIKELEEYFGRYRPIMDEEGMQSPFHVKLIVTGTQVRFEPGFADLETAIIAIFEDLLQAAREIPRVETRLFTSLAEEKAYLSAMPSDDKRVADARKLVRAIIARNTVGLQKHLMSYERYKYLLTPKSEKRVAEFLRGDHTLDEYEVVCTPLWSFFSSLLAGNQEAQENC